MTGNSATRAVSVGRLAAFATLVALLVAISGATAQQAPRAKVSSVIADVTHRLAGADAWARSKLGTLLGNGDRVRTARRSKAQVDFPDESFVRLGQLSELLVRQATGAGREMNITRGRLYGSFVKGAPMTITSPQATAAIRGTRIEAEIGPGGERWKCYDGEIEIVTRTGRRIIVGPGHEARVGAMGDIFLRSFSAPEKFAGGNEQSWFSVVKPGLQTTGFQGPNVRRLRESRLALERIAALQGRDTFLSPDRRGDLVVEIKGARGSAYSPSGPDTAGALLALATLVGQGLLSQDEKQQEGEPPRVSENQFSADAYVIAAEKEWGAGLRLRPRGVTAGVYWELEATVGPEFRQAGESQVTGSFITLRDESWGDLRLGRQRFLKSPVNNGEIGTLMNFVTADAAVYSPPAGRFDVDLGYLFNTEIYDNDPDFEGWYGRVATPVGPCMLGVNVLGLSGEGDIGITGELSAPLVPRYVTLYGEAGQDAFDNGLYTVGLHFPKLYQDQRIDLFVEYAGRDTYDPQVSLRVYKEFDDRWTGLFILEKVEGQDVDLGAGFSYTFGDK